MKYQEKISIPAFVSYAHENEDHKIRFLKHLKSIKKYDFKVWNDRQLCGGEQWEENIKAQLRKSKLIFCLLSVDFFDSDFIEKVELSIAMEQEKKGVSKLVPIIVEPVDIEDYSIKNFQIIPKNVRPIIEWPNKDTAWMNVVKEIRRILEKIDSLSDYSDVLGKVHYNRNANLQIIDTASYEEIIRLLQEREELDAITFNMEPKCAEWIRLNIEYLVTTLTQQINLYAVEACGSNKKEIRWFIRGNLAYLEDYLSEYQYIRFEEILSFLKEQEIPIYSSLSLVYEKIWLNLAVIIANSKEENFINISIDRVLKPIVLDMASAYKRLI